MDGWIDVQNISQNTYVFKLGVGDMTQILYYDMSNFISQ